MLETTPMDPLTLTNRVFEVVAEATNTLISCRTYAARSKLNDRVIAPLHVGSLTVRLNVRQLQSSMVLSGHKASTAHMDAHFLEEFDHVLQTCYLSFSLLNGRLKKLGLTQTNEMSQSAFVEKLQYIRGNQQMDLMKESIQDLGRAITILRIAFESYVIQIFYVTQTIDSF